MDKNDLKTWLLSNLDDAQLASGGRQIVCRCHLPGCDDTKRHLYIGPFDDSDKPIMYNCMKCPGHGFVNQNFIELYGCDSDVGREVVKVNKGSSIKTFNSNKSVIYNIHNNFITDCQLSMVKLKYINERLGTNLTYQDCLDKKIVLNLLDLLNSNYVKQYTRHENIISQLNGAFVGFLTRTNGALNMRNLAEGKVYSSIDRKYINYNIFGQAPDDDFYILPTTFDPNRKVKLYIGEGPFDILGIYYNVITDNDNALYIAGKGKAYYSIIEYFVTSYGLYDLEIHLFPDKDVSDNSMMAIANYLKPFGFEFYMYRNRFPSEKDFGVPKNRIMVEKRKL